MTLPRIRGHEEVRGRLVGAAASGALSQSILLHGARGVGKERIGLWLAQLLVCSSPTAEGPCGSCQPCRLVLRLEHPDVHWFFPLPRPDNASADKLREKLEDLRAAELQLRRENPGHVPSYDKAPAIFLAAVMRIQQLATVKPAMGRRKVIVVGDAELMVPQESSPEAANAFLKLLEEPPDDTTVIMTSSQPGALLPTILSRVLAIRVGPVERGAVRAFLEEEMGTPPAEAERLAGLARGAIGAAIRLAASEGSAGAAASRGRELLIAALSSGAVPRFAAGSAQRPFGGRGLFGDELEALADWLRDLLAVSAGAEEQVADPEARQLLRRIVARKRVHPLGAAAALERVARAQELAQGNVNPQLILADLLRGIQTDVLNREERSATP
jgi:DNA polymerase III subunit delta'